MYKNDSIKECFLIAKVMKEIKKFEEYLPKITPPIISDKKLIYKRKIPNKKIIEYENDVKYYNIEKKLVMKNGDVFEGILGKKSKDIYLKKGVYTYSSGDKYIGNFNSKNNFEGYGKIKFKDNSEFESVFSNGFPIKNGKFKNKLKDGSYIYFQSNFKKNKKLNNNKIVFDENTIIETTKKNEKIYSFFGIFKNGKIIGDIIINKKIDNNRFVELRCYFKDGKIDGLLKIKDIKPGNTFTFMGEYKYGYKDGYFKIKDTMNNIKINNEFHDILNSINIIGKILKKGNKDIMKLLIENNRKKILEIKYNKFVDKMKKIMKLFLKKYFIKIHYFLNQYKYLYLFNKKYKTNYNLDIGIIHLNKIKLGIEGLNLLCKIHFFNLYDLSLSETDINDFSSLKNAHFQSLQILSLGKNNIHSIEFINLLPFPKLKNLMLGVNLISDLNPLKNYKSNNIKVLFLLDNKISDITPLINMDTPNLEELYLGSNINDIAPLSKCKFPKLKQLSLNNNKIQNIAMIKEFNFLNLELLILSNNKIEKIGSLLKAKFPKLNEISLKNNLLTNTNILLKFPISFQNLKKLDISKNKYNIGTDDFNNILFSIKKKIKDINY